MPEKYPLCRAVQGMLAKYRGHDPEDFPSELGLVMQAYDCSCGCIDETTWPLEDLERSIAGKFRIAIIGILTYLGYDELEYAIIVEPEYDGCTEYAVFLVGTDRVILRDACKAWHFGHDNGTIDDLETFFQNIANDIPPKRAKPASAPLKVTKYEDIYDFLCDVEMEIGWAPTLEALAQAAGKTVEYRNGEGPDPLDDGDTRWAFAVINN